MRRHNTISTREGDTRGTASTERRQHRPLSGWTARRLQLMGFADGGGVWARARRARAILPCLPGHLPLPTPPPTQVARACGAQRAIGVYVVRACRRM